MTVICECLRRMEQDVTKVLSTNIRKDFVTPVTDMELPLAVRHGAMNCYPGWDAVNLEFYETYSDFI